VSPLPPRLLRQHKYMQGHLLKVGESRCAFTRPMVVANMLFVQSCAMLVASPRHMEAQVQDYIADAGPAPAHGGVQASLSPLENCELNSQEYTCSGPGQVSDIYYHRQ
jgi:hypothetical protein